jgi:nucleotide-binding universal stress UspA family protein
MVSGESEHAPERILVAVDESDMTDDVLRWAAEFAVRFETRPTVVHASRDELEDDSSWLSGELKKVRGGGTMETVVTKTRERPAESIVGEARARSAHLLVIGSRGAGSADQRLFGSVAESVLLSSPCPVLVVVPGNRQA